jgi:subtilisin family serine protease
LAPGFEITGITYLSPGKRKIGKIEGTSFATPIVAAIAALVLSLQPKLSWQDVRALLVKSCGQRTTSTPDPKTGAGVLSAALALPQPQPLTHLLGVLGSWLSALLGRARKART